MPFWVVKFSVSPARKLAGLIETVAPARVRLSESLTARGLSSTTAAPPPWKVTVAPAGRARGGGAAEWPPGGVLRGPPAGPPRWKVPVAPAVTTGAVCTSVTVLVAVLLTAVAPPLPSLTTQLMVRVVSAPALVGSPPPVKL